MPFMSVAFPLITGACVMFPAPVYMLMANKVNKRGVMFVFCTVFGLSYLLMGYAYMLPYMLVAGVIAEAIMWAPGSYRSVLKNTIGYCAFSIMYVFAALLPIYMFGIEYFSEYGQEIMDIYGRIAYSPLLISLTLFAAVAMAAVGCIAGQRMLKKHFIKSGILTQQSGQANAPVETR
jgi:energy-coupling factor transport system substrate-specific component